MPDKKLLSMVPEVKKFIISKVIFSWISLITSIIMWFALGYQLENYRLGNGILFSVFLLIIFCILIRFSMIKLIAKSTYSAISIVKLKLRNDIYNKLLRIGSNYNDYFPTSEIVQLAGEGVEQLESYFGITYLNFFMLCLHL